ncbi:MAG: hypothetical protein ACRCZI_09740 [Cetobacterium sp.]
MSAALTIDSLKVILGREVEEIHLTIAKSSVLGLDAEVIANTLGVTRNEIEELMESADYKDVRLLVGAEQAKERVERDYGWDGIEGSALKKLGRRVELENDTDTLLRIAAVANRATRRTAPPKESPLDPSQAGARVPLTLTKRFTEKLNGAGQVIERSETQQISVLNGSALNPTFKEVNSLLQGEPVIPPQAPRTSEAYIEQVESNDEEDFSLEALKEMAKGIRGHG